MGMNGTSNNTCKISRCVKIALMAIFGIAALGWIVLLLWNWLMPSLFVGAQTINYCQALGILLLSKILFGSFHGRRHGHWKEHRQHWESMTPEEREKIKCQFKSRWGNWCGTPKHDDPSEKDNQTRPE